MNCLTKMEFMQVYITHNFNKSCLVQLFLVCKVKLTKMEKYGALKIYKLLL